MPSFDVVSEIDTHELTNAVDQTNREVTNRFDFKGTNSRIERVEFKLTLIAPAEFQIKQVTDILQTKLAKRGIDVRCLELGAVEKISGDKAKRLVTVKTGIEQEKSKQIQKLIKDSKLKVQGSIQGDLLRIAGAKKDDLQAAIQLVRQQVTDLPLQFINFRD